MKFLVSKTYSETTPESSKQGDFSDTGFVFEDQVYTLQELITLIKNEGLRRDSRSETWFDSGWYMSCYQTCTQRNESLHIELIK